MNEPKTVVERYYKEIGIQRRLSLADEIFAPDFKLFPFSEPPYGPEGVKNFIRWLEDAGVAAPTGKPFELREFVFWRVQDGLITEREVILDRWSVAQQLGAFR